MAFPSTNSTSTSGGGFDQARVELQPGSLKDLSKSQYDALPLSQRIEMVLQRKVRFFKNGAEVSSSQAMRGF